MAKMQMNKYKLKASNKLETEILKQLKKLKMNA